MQRRGSDPQFLQSIQASLHYWQAKTQSLTPEQVQWLDARRQNLHQAILFGLSQPETWEETAVLLIQAFDFSEFRGYWPEWIAILEEALDNAPEKETVIYGRLQSELGQLYRLVHKFAEALNQHQNVLTLANKLGDPKLKVIAYQNLAEAYFRANQFSEAKKIGLKAHELVQSLPQESRLHAVVLQTLGGVTRSMGDYETAENYMQQAITYWQKLDNTVYRARLLNDLGFLFLDRNNYEASEESYLKALALLEPTANVIDKERIRMNLGVLYFRQARWEEAEKRFLQVDRVALAEHNELALLSTTLNNIGNVYIKLKRFASAEDFLTRAIKRWRELANELDLANSLGSLAEVKAAINQTDEAIKLYQEALLLLAKFPDSVWGKKLSRNFEAALHELAM